MQVTAALAATEQAMSRGPSREPAATRAPNERKPGYLPQAQITVKSAVEQAEAKRIAKAQRRSRADGQPATSASAILIVRLTP